MEEKVLNICISELHPFPNHPFKVIDDDSMKETAESVREYGVLVPIIVRERELGGYEIISGHRRKRACEIAEIDTIPAIVRNWIMIKKVDNKSKTSYSLIRRETIIMRMRTSLVVKANNVLKNGKLEFVKRGIVSAVCLFGFEIFEKALHNRVVVWMSLIGKRLNHAERVEMLTKAARGILRASVGMKHDSV